VARAGCGRAGRALAYCAMAVLQRLRAWWRKDELERAEEETRMTEAERDVAEEDFEERKDDVAASTRLGGGAADYERDSEPPPKPES
jgi:hypothetical protein